MSTRPPIRIRQYNSMDAQTTARIFQRAIMTTASADYTPEQITAWAQRPDISAWDRSMRRRNSYVALIGQQVVGFSDVSQDGYIDMLYIAPEFARRGVARTLLTFLEKYARSCGAKQLSANVSLTARVLFETQGFQIETEQHPVINGVALTNFRMTKELGA